MEFRFSIIHAGRNRCERERHDAAAAAAIAMVLCRCRCCCCCVTSAQSKVEFVCERRFGFKQRSYLSTFRFRRSAVASGSASASATVRLQLRLRVVYVRLHIARRLRNCCCYLDASETAVQLLLPLRHPWACRSRITTAAACPDIVTFCAAASSPLLCSSGSRRSRSSRHLAPLGY